jgi:hypothetical protein
MLDDDDEQEVFVILLLLSYRTLRLLMTYHAVAIEVLRRTQSQLLHILVATLGSFLGFPRC